MIGVEPLHRGSVSFQTTFSSVVHLTGRFLSELTPLRLGPRHWGQFSASAIVSENIMTTRPLQVRLSILVSFFILELYGPHGLRPLLTTDPIGTCNEQSPAAIHAGLQEEYLAHP